MFRRSSASQAPNSSNAAPTRAATISGSNNPYRTVPPDIANLSLDDSTPPPPDYNTALRHTLSGPPQGYVPPQTTPPQGNRQQQEAPLPPPVHTRPASQYAPPPQSPPSRTSTHDASRRDSVRAPAPSGASVARRSSVEDNLAPLGKYDICILLDDSPSMVDHWDEAREALMGVVNKCIQYDKDGIDIWFMNNEDCHLKNVTDASTVRESFDSVVPTGSTPTGMMLDEILRDYVDSVEDAKTTKTKIKPLIVLCLTDGRPDDPDGVKDCLIEMAGRLDEVRAPPYQLGVQFIQIGNDEEATAFLIELDDDLKAEAGVRDIVDTTPYEGRITPEFVLKAALGSVVKRLDN